MRKTEAYIRLLSANAPTEKRMNVGLKDSLEKTNLLWHDGRVKIDVTEFLEGDNGGIDNFHVNLDESSQSKFEASDISVRLSLLDSGIIDLFEAYPAKGHFWKKLPNHVLWKLANQITANADITKLYEFVYFNREYNFPFVGLIDPKSMFLDEKEGVLTFTAYSYIKTLAQIPTSWITRAVEVDGDEHQRWHMNLATDNAINLIWEHLRGISNVQNFSPILNIELESAYTGGMLGFMLNLNEEIDFSSLTASDTRPVEGFTFIGANRLHVKVRRVDHSLMDIEVGVVGGGDVSTPYALTYSNSPFQLVYAPPFYLWERQTALIEQPFWTEQIPSAMEEWSPGTFEAIQDCIECNISGTSYRWFIRPEAWSSTDNFTLGRVTFGGYGLVPSYGGYSSDWDGYTGWDSKIHGSKHIKGMVYVADVVVGSSHSLYVYTECGILYRLILGTTIHKYTIMEFTDDSKEIGGLYWFRNTDTLLLIEITDGGGFSALHILNGFSGNTIGMRTGSVPFDDAFGEYNLDWGDIDYSQMFEISYNQNLADGSSENITAFCGVTQRSPIRFFVLDTKLEKCLLYTNLETALGFSLGSTAYLTRRYKGIEVEMTYPSGTTYTVTEYYNEVWGMVCDGTLKGAMFFSYNVSNAGQIRVLNLKNMNASQTFADLAKCAGAVMFDTAIVDDRGDGDITVIPQLNIISRSKLHIEANHWYLDDNWQMWQWQALYNQKFDILDIDFQGGKTQLARIHPLNIDMRNFPGIDKGSLKLNFIFDRHFAKMRSAGVLAYHSQNRQQWQVTVPLDKITVAGETKTIKINDIIHLRHTAEIGDFIYTEARVLAIDYNFEDHFANLTCVTTTVKNGMGDIAAPFPTIPGVQQITGGEGSID